MLQHAVELGVGLCAVPEPTRVPTTQQWYLSMNGLAAIYIDHRDTVPKVDLIFRNDNFVVKYSDL